MAHLLEQVANFATVIASFAAVSAPAAIGLGLVPRAGPGRALALALRSRLARAPSPQSARAAGCSVLAVPYGYNEGQSVQTLDVDAIVDSIEAAAHWVAAR